MGERQKQSFHNKKKIANKQENTFTLTTDRNVGKTAMRYPLLLVGFAKLSVWAMHTCV